jgi:phage terminase small subunit
MARAPNEKQIKAKELYDEGYKLIDISKELDTAESTIRVWKNRFKWDNEECNVSEKKCNVTVSKKKSVTSKKVPIADEVKEVLENTELTDGQRLFCVIYAKRQNATKAYLKAYTCTYETAMVEGCRLLRNPKIREQVDKLMEAELNKEFLKRGLIQQYKDIAFADIGDYLEFGKKQVPQWTKNSDGIDMPVVDPNTGEQKIKEYSYVDLKDSTGVDTGLITEVSEGKDGIKFKLADKMKAMEMLAKLSNLLSDEEKTKLELEYKRLQNARLEAEIDRLKGNINANENNTAKLDSILEQLTDGEDDE